jgi:ABC-type branched-subunit amino acid transport system substrate-binding protein
MSATPTAGTADIEQWLRVSADELTANGRLDRPMEFVHAYGLGLPSGTAATVERAYTTLVEEDVLLIVGPAIGDNALVATPLADRFRVPTLNWAGAERARSEYMFHLQVGSHEDESIVIARHLAAQSVRRVGVVYDKSPIGLRHLTFLQTEAHVLGLHLVTTAAISPLAGDATPQVEQILEARPEALVYLGLGLSAPAVARVLRTRGWDGQRVMNTAGIRGYDPEFGKLIDGWVYVDMCSDGNTTLAALRQRMSLSGTGSYRAATRYDLGRLVAEGLARASERTRDGAKEGLEQVKWLPAAEGYEGTLLGFGKYDRGALHGRYLVLRQWRDASTVEVLPVGKTAG